MAAKYPGELPVYETLKIVDNTTEIKGASTNPWLDEIIAICTELGINVKGSATDLKTRLAIAIENDGKLKYFKICTSSTRPASPNEGTLIYETDTDKLYKCTVGGATPTWVEVAGSLPDTFRVNLSILPFLPGQVRAHYHIKLTTENNPEAEAVEEIETKDVQTGCSYFNGVSFVDFPAEGVNYIHQSKILTWLIEDITTQPYFVFFRQYNVETASYREWHSLGKNILQAGPQGESYDSKEFILQGYLAALSYFGGVSDNQIFEWVVPYASALLDITVLSSPYEITLTDVDFRRCAFEGYSPGVADSICGGDKINSGRLIRMYKKTDLNAWDVNFNSGDILRCHGTIDSGYQYTNLVIALRFKKI